MKKKTHPKTNDIKIKCACGAVYETASTLKEDYTVEICAGCHPFFTGKQKLIDSAGKVEKFQRKYANFNKKEAEKQ